MIAREQWPDVRRLYHESRWTLEEVGEHFGVTRERVRQILKAMGAPARSIVQAYEVLREQGACLPHEIACDNCGRAFIPACNASRYSKRRHYCSPECRRQKRRTEWKPIAEPYATAARLIQEQRLGYRAALIAAGMSPEAADVNAFRLRSQMLRHGLEIPGVVRMTCRRCKATFEHARVEHPPFMCEPCRDSGIAQGPIPAPWGDAAKLVLERRISLAVALMAVGMTRDDARRGSGQLREQMLRHGISLPKTVVVSCRGCGAAIEQPRVRGHIATWCLACRTGIPAEAA